MVQLSKTHTVLLSFQTSRAPPGIDSFISCWNKSPQQIVQAVSSIASAAPRRCILIVDSLTSLSKASVQPNPQVNLTHFLMSLLQPQSRSSPSTVSLIAVYHTDVALRTNGTPYSPSPLSLLEHLATTVITTHSLPVMLAEKQARDRSLVPPSFGLAEEKEGLLIGLKSQAKGIRPEQRGVVLQVEHRRKSGRGVLEWYFLPEKIASQASTSGAFKETLTLLDDHPSFKKVEDLDENVDQDMAGVTFELGLTDRQRLERDGVVLPYFDAQKIGGGGEGGRILYDMGAEDDFDEEEDEI